MSYGNVCFYRSRASTVKGQSRHKRHVALAFGLGVSGFFLWLAFRHVNMHSFWHAFTLLNYGPLLVSIAFLWASIYIRSIRWRMIMGLPSVDQPSFYRATALGVLSNMVLPGRAGELVRIFTLAKLRDTTMAGPLASGFVDRLTDLLVLFICGIAIYVVFPVHTLLSKWLLISAVIFIVIIAAVVLRETRVSKAIIKYLAMMMRRWLRQWSVSLEAFLRELKHELGQMGKGWLRLELFFVVLMVVGADYGAIAFLIKSFKLSLPLLAPLLVWLFFAAGSLLPSAPGYVGVYQMAAIWALALFSVSSPISVALATVFQVSTLVVALMASSHSSIHYFRVRRKSGHA